MTLKNAFGKIIEEHQDLTLSVLSGSIPPWLRGSYLRNGPGSYEFGQEHWFDGAAMVSKLTFSDSGVTYSNKYLASRSFVESKKRSKMSHKGFASAQNHRGIWKVIDWFKAPSVGDNTNVNIVRINGKLYALTETTGAIEFDLHSLETIDSVSLAIADEQIAGKLTTAHPHIDHKNQQLINFETKLGATSSYCYYSLDLKTKETAFIGAIETRLPAYTHAFGLTEHYIIHVEFPLRVNPLSLRFGNKPYIKNFKWQPEKGTIITVLDRRSGKQVCCQKTQACLAFHFINCYETDDEVIVDLLPYNSARIVDDLYVHNLLTNEVPIKDPAIFTRWRVPLNEERAVKKSTIQDAYIELPIINYKNNNTRPYQYVYGIGITNKGKNRFYDSITKVNVNTGGMLQWREDGYYVGEALFVQKDGVLQEDDGVLISIATNYETKHSLVVILDAKDLSLICKLALPTILPLGFHGIFIINDDQP